MKVVRIVWMLILLGLSGVLCGETEQRVGENVVLRPFLVEQAPRIDGVLDDLVWQQPPMITGPFITNNPVYGETLPQETLIWIAYDPNTLYFAFYCKDGEPDKIKATVTRRDQVFGEDWIGVDIDAMGNRQFTYEHICNPLGIQMDVINSSSSGESLEPDWVWRSAGRKVTDGYIVEMAIPLKSIKFKSGTNVTMNMAFYRFVSRTSANASWPEISQQKGYFNSLVPVVFEKLNKQLRLEVLPALTVGSIWDRETPEKWSPADTSTQFGVGLKFGLTSSINAELTVNPDYSQVESDEFQVETNQRFPLFYSEKRPFFMEVGNQFNLAACIEDSNLTTAIHTRLIVDPAWGAKLSGEKGKFSFGFLAAGDEYPGRPWENDQNPRQGKNAAFLINRIKYSLKGDDYIGLLYSGRKFGEQYNYVIGGDFRFRLKGNHNLSGNGLYSFSRESQSLPITRGGSFILMYDYGQKPLGITFFAEHVDPHFQMDTAFYKLTGFTRLTGYIGPNFYPNKDRIPWLKRINVFGYGFYSHDRFTDMNEVFALAAIRLNFIRQGALRLDYRYHKEIWQGRYFNQYRWFANGSVQLTHWLNLRAYISIGDRIYYQNPIHSFLGKSLLAQMAVSLQPNAKLTQDFSYTREVFNSKNPHSRIYDLDILIFRTTYQFNRYLFIRGLVQYDSYREKVLSDLLASFTLIPGTVVHLGYGSLHQKLYWDQSHRLWDDNPSLSRYYQIAQSFFFKVSYLYRF